MVLVDGPWDVPPKRPCKGGQCGHLGVPNLGWYDLLRDTPKGVGVGGSLGGTTLGR